MNPVRHINPSLPLRDVSDRQKEWLRAIDLHQAAFGTSPTTRELMKAMRTKSTNGVVDQLRILERNALIDRGIDDGMQRHTARRPIVLTARARLAIGSERPYTLAEFDTCTELDMERLRATIALLETR